MAAPASAAPGSVGTAPAGRAQLVRLEITDFRNIAHATLDVPPDGIAVVGDNGQGKTNLLEAVAYLELVRSMRGARDRDLVRFGAETFHIAASLSGTRVRRVAAAASRSGEKRVSLDGVEAPRLGDALGALPSVCVSPADVGLVAGGPAERRRMMDIILALTDAAYLAGLRQYRAALARRNAALRAPRQGAAAVHAWDAALAEHGATLVRARHAWAAEFGGAFGRLASTIGEREPMRMRYETAFGAHDDVAAEIAEALEASSGLDAQRGATQRGPHRDDLALTLGARPLKTTGSAGQQRT
ncbi:MAG TPA: DNA replication and repair protein RecF, partial [Gemmatimonadaceae bacterium]|nr:DNA replication and repair protein RecF [Gemmatimonadaceae bacterium]